jgi:outer membrane protein assembly factor BamB
MSSQRLRRWLLLSLLLVLVGSLSTSESRAAEGEGLASSARPVINDSAQRRIQQVEAAIQSGDFPQARAELRRLLDSPEIDGVVAAASADQTASRFQSVTGAAIELLNSLPTVERRQSIEQSEPEAARRLRNFLVAGGTNAELQEIADRYPGTTSARQAQRLLVSWFLDRGHVWQARSVLQKLKRESAAADSPVAAIDRQLKQIEAIETELASQQQNRDVGTESRVWQAAAAFEDGSVGWFQQALDEHRRQAIPVLPRLNPVAVGSVMIGRTLNRLVAVEAATGKPLWQAESPATGSQRPSNVPLTGALESLASVSMARQVQLDTTYSRMTVDDGRVLCLEYVSNLGRSLSASGSPIGQRSIDDAQPRNQLVARRVSDGRIEWTRPAFLSGESEFEEATAYFVGVPSVHGDWLVGLLQHDAALFAYALDRRDGTPQWMLKIGERTGITAADADWTSIACPIVSADGLLICSTGAGLITAVDPVFRRVAWARRYNRTDEPPAGSPLPGAANRLTRRWWSGWREVTLLPVAGSGDSSDHSTLLYAGPDVRGVCNLDAATGEELATVAASQPLYLQAANGKAGATQPALLISRHSLTAFNPRNGTTLWSTGIPEPAGRGFVFNDPRAAKDSYYVFPARDGTSRLVRLRDGHATTGHGIDSGTPRTWTLCATGVLEQTFEDLQLLPLPAINSHGTLAWPSGFGSETGRDGALLASIKRADSEEALRATVTRAGLGSLTKTIPNLPPRNEQAFDRPGVVHSVAAIRRARELHADSIAFDLLLSLSGKNPNGAVSLLDSGPERIVRYDRWIQGQLTDLLSGTDSPSTVELKDRFEKAVDVARNSRDPFALARFVERLRIVPGVGAAETQPEGRVGRSFLQNEIALLRLAVSNEPSVATDARKQLVELYLTNRYERDAAAIVEYERHNRLQQAGAGDDSLLPADRTNKLLAAAQDSDWKSKKPKLSERSDRFEEVRYFPVPVSSSRGILFDRLNVAVRLVGKSGSSLRFYGDGQAGYWKLELPNSESALHTWFSLPRGWGIGRLLILRIGTELYGITPYSDNGEPRAQLRWTLDMADGNRLNTHQLAHPIPGFGAEDLTPLDGFDQPMAQVGPVQAGYLCYRDRGQLVCLDPETGQQLWTRSEVQPQMRCVGNEQSIWLIDDAAGTATELRVTDGAAQGAFRFADLIPHSAQSDSPATSDQPQLLKTRDGHWLFGWPRRDSASPRFRQLALLNVRSQQVEWTQTTITARAVFEIGRHWFGVIDENSQLSIRDVRSGAIVAAHHADVPDGIRSAHCITDSQSHILAFSTEPESGFQAVGEPRFGFRAPLVNGSLLAISVHDGSLLWRQSVNGERLPLDQPRSLPVITLTSRAEQAGKTAHVLRIVDRRYGETLIRRKSVELFPHFALDPNAALQRVTLRFSRSALRIDYDTP